MVNLDSTVIRTAATAGLIVIIPSTVIASVLRDSNSNSGSTSPLALLFLALTIFGFITAGYGAGRMKDDTPIAHGLVSALVCWGVVQAFGVIKLLAQGDSVRWAALPVLAMFAATCGVLGALFADWYRRKDRRDHSETAHD